MNSSLGFRFGGVALAAMLSGLVAGACLGSSSANVGANCSVTSDCAPSSECSAGTCKPYTACMTDAQCKTGQQCALGACRTTCSSNTECEPLGLICSTAAGQCLPLP